MWPGNEAARWQRGEAPQGLDVLDTVQVTESISWTLPTLVGTKLYLRDKKHILALDLPKTTD